MSGLERFHIEYMTNFFVKEKKPVIELYPVVSLLSVALFCESTICLNNVESEASNVLILSKAVKMFHMLEQYICFNLQHYTISTFFCLVTEKHR